MESKENMSDEDPFRQLVMDTPINPQLPQTNEYSLTQFYVRECYDAYYNQTFHLMHKYKLISISGTRGLVLLYFHHDILIDSKVLESLCFTNILLNECGRNIQIGL